MIWLLFTALVIMGASIFMYQFSHTDEMNETNKDKALTGLSVLFVLAGIIGLFMTSNWRIVILLLLAALFMLFIYLTVTDDGYYIFGNVMTCGIIILVCIFNCHIQVDEGVTDYTLVSETKLVSLGDTVTTDVSGIGTRTSFYVQSEAENSYTYRYETISEIDGSSVYKKEVVSGRVEEKEFDDCKVPLLKTYERKHYRCEKNGFTGKTKDIYDFSEQLYIFEVPTGTIQKTINLE